MSASLVPYPGLNTTSTLNHYPSVLVFSQTLVINMNLGHKLAHYQTDPSETQAGHELEQPMPLTRL